ncbi:hypothetical protein A3194_13600 [Candidatus Thiodiazotropha endoloripes]|nr:hypothetical protein A3194_13600 [Candidatus Thiodiazotropha endoloripes]
MHDLRGNGANCALYVIFAVDGMSDRAGTYGLITQLGTVWALGTLAANHAGMIFCGDANTAELIFVIS